MPRCSAPGCRNMGSHTFPKDPNLRILWEKATNKENFKASQYSRLCYDHFKPSDYVDMCYTVGLGKRMSPFHRYLKKTAVPSIFSNKIQQSRTSGASENEAKTPSRQQMSRHLKKGVVPSIFPWTRKTSTAEKDATQIGKSSCPATKNNVLKNNTVSLQKAPKQEESDCTEINNVLRNRSVRLRNRKAYLLNRRCSVPHCNARPTNEISLYPCPNNAAVRNEWAEALRVSYQYVKNMVACSLHFSKIDFIQSRNSERVLKYNAVPSRNLTNRKKVVIPVKHKLLRKDVTAKAETQRQQTMTDTVVQTKETVQDEDSRECRACLKKLDGKHSCCNVFQAWAPPWEGMEASIAEDMAKLANVEISRTDRHSKILCAPCYQRLLDAVKFASQVRNCDLLVRMRFTAEIDFEKVWPKPIQVDKNINSSVFDNSMDVEIKQEVLSDEEYPVNSTENPYVETELANLDIKIEPEELVEPPPMNITINGTISLDPLNSENKDVKNGTEQQETHLIQMEVKQEPTSEGEQEMEQTPDLSLECLLCTKSFNSVTGLKAHVIAQHSYKSVKRKANGSMSPEKKRCDLHQCKICKRSFQTSTDLMVHETCHNKHACYGCTEKFDSFELLTRHRKRCKASIGNSVHKLKTLDDVKRPLPEVKTEYIQQEIEKIKSEATCTEGDIEMKQPEFIPDEDVEMRDIKREQIDENGQENPEVINNDKVENCKNTLDGVTLTPSEEADGDKKSRSLIDEVDSDKLLESVIGIVDIESDKKLKSVIEELENDKNLESVVEAVDNKLESVIKQVESDSKKAETETEYLESEEKTTKIVKEYLGSEEETVESVKEYLESGEKTAETVKQNLESEEKNKASVKENLGSEEKKTESENKEDPESNMKLLLEIHSTEKETEPTLNDADMLIETLDNNGCT